MKTDHPIYLFLSAGAEAFRVLTGGYELEGPYRFASLTLKGLERRLAAKRVWSRILSLVGSDSSSTRLAVGAACQSRQADASVAKGRSASQRAVSRASAVVIPVPASVTGRGDGPPG